MKPNLPLPQLVSCYDIDCPSSDLNPRPDFHNGMLQIKNGRGIDPSLLKRIHSRPSKICRRLLLEVQVQAALQRSKPSVQELQMATDAFSDDELAGIEREHPGGISSEEIVGLFMRRNIKFTEATLRKYIQQGLLPRSRRVGLKGKHRGSQGMYPSTVIRRIQRLKSMMLEYTIDQIKQEFLFVRGDVEELERTLEKIFSALSTAAKSSREGDTSPRVANKELADARNLASELVAKITSVETRLTMQARLHREAI